jgi:hypothetical protein
LKNRKKEKKKKEGWLLAKGVALGLSGVAELRPPHGRKKMMSFSYWG